METIRIHSQNGRMLAAIVTATMLVLVGQMIIAGQWLDLVRYSGPLGLILLFVWAALWSPYVESSPGAVQIQNVFSIVTIPWPALRHVEDRYGLTLDTAYGEFTAWSATRPRMRSMASDAEAPRNPATEVQKTWRALQKAGHLDDPRLEPDAHPKRWRSGVLQLALVLSAWATLTAFVVR